MLNKWTWEDVVYWPWRGKFADLCVERRVAVLGLRIEGTKITCLVTWEVNGRPSNNTKAENWRAWKCEAEFCPREAEN